VRLYRKSLHSQECKPMSVNTHRLAASWSDAEKTGVASIACAAGHYSLGKPSVAYVRSSDVLSEDRHRRCDLDLWPFDPKINTFPGIIVEYFCVQFGDPSCIVFEISAGKKNRQTDRQTAVKNLPTPLPWARIITLILNFQNVINYFLVHNLPNSQISCKSIHNLLSYRSKQIKTGQNIILPTCDEGNMKSFKRWILYQKAWKFCQTNGSPL